MVKFQTLIWRTHTMSNKLIYTRRSALTSLAGVTAVAGLPAFALTKSEAESLIDRLTSDVFAAINAGSSQNVMFSKFEQIFARYADVPLIAQKALGPTWRSASAAQRKAYVAAFRGYMARYYGKRFEEFIGATVSVDKSRKTSGGYLVDSTIKLKGSAPFKAQWHVIDARGKTLMYNLFLEGVSVLSDVRVQIGSMLDKRGGNIDKLTSHLRTAA
jgi:phospholipid transport system substrate-binding protein